MEIYNGRWLCADGLIIRIEHIVSFYEGEMHLLGEHTADPAGEKGDKCILALADLPDFVTVRDERHEKECECGCMLDFDFVNTAQVLAIEKTKGKIRLWMSDGMIIPVTSTCVKNVLDIMK